jgi:hypothetical protein
MGMMLDMLSDEEKDVREAVVEGLAGISCLDGNGIALDRRQIEWLVALVDTETYSPYHHSTLPSSNSSPILKNTYKILTNTGVPSLEVVEVILQSLVNRGQMCYGEDSMDVLRWCRQLGIRNAALVHTAMGEVGSRSSLTSSTSILLQFLTSHCKPVPLKDLFANVLQTPPGSLPTFSHSNLCILAVFHGAVTVNARFKECLGVSAYDWMRFLAVAMVEVFG